MTTPAAAAAYLRSHLATWQGKGYAVYNPHNKPLEELPIIFGFNNGGSPGWFSAILLSQDGEVLGGHMCSNEGYMTHDLGILEGARPDRHETFRKHYPDGYKMDFIHSSELKGHAGLDAAIAANRAKYSKTQEAE
jgi:hypothetical protein